MIYPSMLVEAAAKAGMDVPPNPADFDAKKYPRFDIFCKVQLCRPIIWGEHWDNAKVVARIPEEKLATVTLQDLIDDGLAYPI